MKAGEGRQAYQHCGWSNSRRLAPTSLELSIPVWIHQHVRWISNPNWKINHDHASKSRAPFVEKSKRTFICFLHYAKLNSLHVIRYTFNAIAKIHLAPRCVGKSWIYCLRLQISASLRWWDQMSFYVLPGQSLGLGDHVDVVFRPALPASIAKIPEGLLAKQRGVGRNNFSPM